MRHDAGCPAHPHSTYAYIGVENNCTCKGDTVMEGYIIDGIYYEEYPTPEERLEALREDRDYWKRLAFNPRKT